MTNRPPDCQMALAARMRTRELRPLVTRLAGRFEWSLLAAGQPAVDSSAASDWLRVA